MNVPDEVDVLLAVVQHRLPVLEVADEQHAMRAVAAVAEPRLRRANYRPA
ncbi:MAG: hypothetical protein M3125_04095 [Gemmatimonadota bacterium]|nr:hypothetical protein [Gemmatimonadota bacterium]